MKIAVDAMGGDRAPAVVVEGAVQAARDFGFEIVLVGQRGAVQAEMERYDRAGLSLTLKHTPNRWANIVLPLFFLAFNAIGLPTYPSAYDKFLIVVGLVFNGLTVWVAWTWRKPAG